jgi:predicted acylesterase/phospholipase RssA
VNKTEKPTLGLAFSGGGNGSSFYIGFLEVMDENNIKPNYIAACSGGCLVAAAYACGTLPEFKKMALSLNKEKAKAFFKKSDGGGLYSMDLIEEEIRKYTKNFNFEDVRPLMGFMAVDLENGEKIILSMGDIARAARISCTLPAVFSPVKWGGKTLVDGGLLSYVPGDLLKQANMDVTIGINMRGHKFIFAENFITGKKMYNYLKHFLYIDQISDFFEEINGLDEPNFEKVPGIFSVIGKSLDLAIAARKQNLEEIEACDLTIFPETPSIKTWAFSPESIKFDYESGRETAHKYLPEIFKLLDSKK